MRRSVRVVCLGTSLTLFGCGPIMNCCDRASGRLGDYLPTGQFKRDFWGRRYFEPYPPRPPAPLTEGTGSKSSETGAATPGNSDETQSPF